MKKIVKVTILLLVFTLFLTGCEYEARMEMSIDQDGKIELNKVLLMDDEMIDALITASEDESQFQIENPSDFKIAKHTDEERWAFIEKDSSDGSIDFTLKEEGSKRYTGKNGYKGFYTTKNLGTVDECSSESSSSRVNIVDEDNLSNKTLFIKDGEVYKSNMTYKSTESTDDSIREAIDKYGAGIKTFLIIDLPVPVKEDKHNADFIEDGGKTLKWDLSKPKDIELEFNLKNTNQKKIFIIAGAGVALLLLILGAGATTKSQKKARTGSETIPIGPQYTKEMFTKEQETKPELQSKKETKKEPKTEPPTEPPTNPNADFGDKPLDPNDPMDPRNIFLNK